MSANSASALHQAVSVRYAGGSADGLMDATLVSGNEGVAVPLVVIAVRVVVIQIIYSIPKGGVAIDMIVSGPDTKEDAEAPVVEGLVVVQVVVAGVGVS